MKEATPTPAALIEKAVSASAGSVDALLAAIDREERPAIGFKEGWDTATELIRPLGAAPETSVANRQIIMAIKTVFPDDFHADIITDSFLPRLNHFLVALNDWLDVGEKIPKGAPGRAVLGDSLKNSWPWLRDFLKEPDTDTGEASRRKELKKQLADTVKKVYFLEHQTQSIAADTNLGADEKYEQIKSCQELVNGIEMLLNISGCLNESFFAARAQEPQRPRELTLPNLQQEYAWLTDPQYPDEKLTENERKTRLLFFAQMAVQRANDNARFYPDVTYGVWKPLTVLTEIHGLPLAEAKKIMDVEAREYGALAHKYGLSRHVTKFAKGLTELTVGGLSALGAVPPDSWLHPKAVALAKNKKIQRAFVEVTEGRVAAEKKKRSR